MNIIILDHCITYNIKTKFQTRTKPRLKLKLCVYFKHCVFKYKYTVLESINNSGTCRQLVLSRYSAMIQ